MPHTNRNRPRRPHRRLPEIASVLYAVLFVLVLLVVLPALGVIPDPLAVGLLTLLGQLSLIAVILTGILVVSACLEEAWCAFLRWRDRRRRPAAVEVVENVRRPQVGEVRVRPSSSDRERR